MRTIKFRALKDDMSNCNFVYGCLVKDEKENPYIADYTADKGYSHASCIKGTEEQFTGFFDKHGDEIYEGDVLGDWNEIDGEMVQSKMQVFWCDTTGAWKLDNSFSQDKSSGDLLSDELANFTYEILGTIYQT